MSRSYKKTPICKDGGNSKKWQKNKANRAVRKSIDLLDGCDYKKYYSQYDICDSISYCTRNEFTYRRWNHLQWCLNYFARPKHDYYEEFKDSFFKGIPDGRSWFKYYVWK